MLCCGDDVLAIGVDPKPVPEGSKGGTVKFKNEKIEVPEMNLGAKLQKKSINEISCWAITSEGHVKAAVNTIEASISKVNQWTIPKGAEMPMKVTFVPELDNSREPGPNDITLHQEMIGVLRRATESGQVNILHEISIHVSARLLPG